MNVSTKSKYILHVCVYIHISAESSYLFELADKLRKQIDDGDKRTYS